MPHAGEFERAFLTLAALAMKRRIEGRMPIALHSFIKEPDSDRVLVHHTFYGKNEAEAQKFKQHHIASCEYYRAAQKDGRTIDLEEEIDELPEFDLEEPRGVPRL